MQIVQNKNSTYPKSKLKKKKRERETSFNQHCSVKQPKIYQNKWAVQKTLLCCSFIFVIFGRVLFSFWILNIVFIGLSCNYYGVFIIELQYVHSRISFSWNIPFLSWQKYYFDSVNRTSSFSWFLDEWCFLFCIFHIVFNESLLNCLVIITVFCIINFSMSFLDYFFLKSVLSFLAEILLWRYR